MSPRSPKCRLGEVAKSNFPIATQLVKGKVVHCFTHGLGSSATSGSKNETGRVELNVYIYIYIA